MLKQNKVQLNIGKKEALVTATNWKTPPWSFNGSPHSWWKMLANKSYRLTYFASHQDIQNWKITDSTDGSHGNI